MKRVNDLILLAATLLLTIGCAEEATTPRNHPQPQEQEEPIPEGLTAFCMEDGATRTTAEYFYKSETDRGLHYYWTEGDHLWVNTGTDLAPVLKQDDGNNIHSQLKKHPEMPTIAVKRATTAKFYFNGTFTAPSYPVRYAGKDNPDGDKVTIKAQQTQTVPNDASHIATDGDCGTAIAQKEGGRYNFTLKHKAAYLTFLPFTSQGVVSGAKLQKIKVSADQAICGTFDFNDNGIDIGSRPTATPTNQSIELSLNSFSIPNTATIATNAATMVIAPGSYTHFTVEYTLHDPVTNKTGIITKQYSGTVTFTASMNKRVSQNLQVTVYPNVYYEWARHSNCPNLNELHWYIDRGEPHFDNSTLWAIMGHLYTGGMWFKKKANISGYITTVSPDGIDYTHSTSYSGYVSHSVVRGRPANSNLNKYFYLPALGFGAYTRPVIFGAIGSEGNYWSSTEFPWGGDDQYCLNFGSNVCAIGHRHEKELCRKWSNSNEDEYRPNGM